MLQLNTPFWVFHLFHLLRGELVDKICNELSCMHGEWPVGSNVILNSITRINFGVPLWSCVLCRTVACDVGLTWTRRSCPLCPLWDDPLPLSKCGHSMQWCEEESRHASFDNGPVGSRRFWYRMEGIWVSYEQMHWAPGWSRSAWSEPWGSWASWQCRWG